MTPNTKALKRRVRIKRLQLHEQQTRAYKSEKRFIFCITGAQAGKSTFGAIWIMREIKQHPFDHYAIVASTYKVLTQATKTVFEQWAPKGAFKFKSAQDKFYYEINPVYFGFPKTNPDPNGNPQGRIYMRSSERADDLVGMTLRAVWFDEAGNAPKRAWINLLNRVEILQGRILVTTTPYTFNWVKEEVDKAIAGEVMYDYINFPTTANPSSNKDSIEDMRRTMTREDFERVYEGKFTRPEGVIYDQFNPDTMILSRKEYQEMKKEDPVLEAICGIDWGYTDPNVQLVINIHQSGKFVIVEEVAQLKATLEQIIDKARALAAAHKISYRYADSAYPMYIEKFNSSKVDPKSTASRNHLYTIPVKKSPESNNQTYLQQGISRIQSLMYDGKFFVLRDCEGLIGELSSYRWKSVEDSMGKNLLTGTPEERQNDHFCDSCRYAIDSHWPKRPAPEKPQAPSGTLDRYLKMMENHNKQEAKVYQQQLDAFSRDGF